MLNAVRRNLLLLSACFALLCPQSGRAANYKDDAATGLADGAGTWVNIWHYPEGDLDHYFRNLKEHGIRNVFLQTSRSNTPAIVSPGKMGEIIDAAHRHGVRVMAWSFAELFNPDADAEKMVQACEFTSATGQHVDGAAPNLEKNLEPARIEKYAQHLRQKLGQNYPLIAVVYSPLNKCFEVKRISWPLLAKYFDTIAPMIYWNSKYEKIEPYSYTVKSIQKIRELSGKPDLEISAIGDGMGSNAAAITEFMKSCRDAEATGISLYPNHIMTDEQMEAIARHPDYIKSNARFRMAAFRQYVRDGHLDSPPGLDPSKAVSRREFYKLVVHLLHPAFVAGKNDSKSRNANMPTAIECKNASGPEAFQILINAGLVAGIPEASSIDGLLDASIYPEEAVSLIASILEMDMAHKAAAQRTNHRFDRWFVPSAQAEMKQKPGSTSQSVNYLDAAQMVLQASSALR